MVYTTSTWVLEKCVACAIPANGDDSHDSGAILEAFKQCHSKRRICFPQHNVLQQPGNIDHEPVSTDSVVYGIVKVCFVGHRYFRMHSQETGVTGYPWTAEQ